MSRPATEGEALVRVTLSGICNTDLEIARGYAGFSGTLGHEFVGVIEEVPDARASVADEPSLTVGPLTPRRSSRRRDQCRLRTLRALPMRRFAPLPAANRAGNRGTGWRACRVSEIAIGQFDARFRMKSQTSRRSSLSRWPPRTAFSNARRSRGTQESRSSGMANSGFYVRRFWEPPARL